jgi:hypothetical protein
VRTLIISDLHLGGISRTDLLRYAELREPLLQAVADVDRVVLLGDVLELRHGPPREALAVAQPFFEDLGRAMDGRELVLLAGNHDHALIEPWLALRAELPEPDALALEQLLEPAEASAMAARVADWAAPARVSFAYPGLWIRPDVYATHGHYLDCHLTVPTIERLSVAAMSRLLGRPAHTFSSVADYESVVAPVYAWRHAVARDTRTGNALNGIGTANAWRTLGGGVGVGDGGGRSRRNGAPRASGARSARSSLTASLRRRALIHGFPLAVAALNRAGFGPLRSEISSGELRGAGLRAMGEVASRLDLGNAHVVFGHTHRMGPLDGDDASEWSRPSAHSGEPARARLANPGNWTYDSIFLTGTPGESPYWPGGCVLVEDTGPPQLKRLLLDRTAEELAPGRAALRSRPA